MTPNPHEQEPDMMPQIDRVADPSIRTPADLNGIEFGYMDGSPQDVLGPMADRGLHTMVMVLGKDQSVELRQKEADEPFFKDFILQKAEKDEGRAEHRAKLLDALGRTETHDRLLVFALTYDEAEAMAAKETLLKQCYGDIDRTAFYEETVNRQNKRTFASFPSFFIKGHVAEGKLNAILPLFVISEFTAYVHEAIRASPARLRQEYVGLFVFSDKICGDGPDGTPKADMVNGILKGWYQDQIRIRNYIAEPSRSGEFLADNIGGMLNECARDGASPAWGAIRPMIKSHSLRWMKMGSDAVFRPMPLPWRA